MIKTNLNKTKEEIVYELLLSLNNGDSYYVQNDGSAMPRISLAIAQYNALVEKGIIVEE